jgi:hypothetical protein
MFHIIGIIMVINQGKKTSFKAIDQDHPCLLVFF